MSGPSVLGNVERPVENDAEGGLTPMLNLDDDTSTAASHQIEGSNVIWGYSFLIAGMKEKSP